MRRKLAVVAASAALWIASATVVDAQATNELIVLPSVAAPGTEHLVEIVGVNIADVAGYTIILDYDEQYLEAVDVNVVDTLSEAVGAEFVQYNDFADYWVLGVLLDAMPPFEGQIIPAVPELELVYANFHCNVLPAAADVDSIALNFVDGLGSPPLNNIFVINFQSVAPTLTSGSISIVAEQPFIRGDSNLNGEVDISDAVTTISYVVGQAPGPDCLATMDVTDDGVIDVADAIYALSFLYLAGPVIPAPFPTAGLDPTPDATTCID